MLVWTGVIPGLRKVHRLSTWVQVYIKKLQVQVQSFVECTWVLLCTTQVHLRCTWVQSPSAQYKCII